MIHIAFDASVFGSLKMVLREMGLEQTESIYAFGEMFSVGPVWQLHEKYGQQARFDWKKENFTDEWQEQQEEKELFEKTIKRLNSLPDGETVAIWASDNAHEQTGLRFALHLLKGKDVDFIVINASEMFSGIFAESKTKHEVLHTGEIPADKLQVIYQQSSRVPPLTDHELEAYETQWEELSAGRENLRIWRNGAIHSLREDYYDGFIVKQAKKLQRERGTDEFMKSARLIGEVLGYLGQVVGDEFLQFRLKQLIKNDTFLIEGNLTEMRFYGVKLNIK